MRLAVSAPHFRRAPVSLPLWSPLPLTLSPFAAKAEPHVVTYRLAVKTSDGTSHVFGPSLPVVFVTTTDAPAARRAAGAGVPLSSRAPPAPFVAPGEMLRALEVMGEFAGAGSAHMAPEMALLPELSLPDVSLPDPEMLLPYVPRSYLVVVALCPYSVVVYAQRASIV